MQTNPIAAIKPVKMTVTRIQSEFQQEHFSKQSQTGVIKNYVYTEQKRYIA